MSENKRVTVHLSCGGVVTINAEHDEALAFWNDYVKEHLDRVALFGDQQYLACNADHIAMILVEPYGTVPTQVLAYSQMEAVKIDGVEQ